MRESGWCSASCTAADHRAPLGDEGIARHAGAAKMLPPAPGRGCRPGRAGRESARSMPAFRTAAGCGRWARCRPRFRRTCRRQHFVDGEQRRHFRHAGQGGVEQRLDLLAREHGAAFQQRNDRVAISIEEPAELALRIHLPDGELRRTGTGTCCGFAPEADLKNIRQRVSRVGGHEQHRPAGVPARLVYGVGRRHRGLSNAAFSDEKTQAGTRGYCLKWG